MELSIELSARHDILLAKVEEMLGSGLVSVALLAEGFDCGLELDVVRAIAVS